VNGACDALAYCLEAGVRKRLGLGSWLRHLEHVQPVPRRLERREEKVGFNMTMTEGVSLQVSFQADREIAWISRHERSEAKLHDPVAAAVPLPEISKVASAHRKIFGDRADASGDLGAEACQLNSHQIRVRVAPEQCQT
jgi:hypothetical protein